MLNAMMLLLEMAFDGKDGKAGNAAIFMPRLPVWRFREQAMGEADFYIEQVRITLSAIVKNGSGKDENHLFQCGKFDVMRLSHSPHCSHGIHHHAGELGAAEDCRPGGPI
jgi:hypothetical protein